MDARLDRRVRSRKRFVPLPCRLDHHGRGRCAAVALVEREYRSRLPAWRRAVARSWRHRRACFHGDQHSVSGVCGCRFHNDGHPAAHRGKIQLVVLARAGLGCHRGCGLVIRPDPGHGTAARSVGLVSMEAVGGLLTGFGIIVTLDNLFVCFLGSLIGTLVGVLPGVGPLAALALLLPITFTMTPVGGMVMLASIFYGAMYGGSTTSILLNIPGEAASVVTCLDGHQMAKQGRAGAALG